MTNKRVSTRYFEKKGSSVQGVKPGTVVTETITGVTGAENKDFYLVSQLSRQGAPAPTHYQVLENEFGDDTMNDIIKLTYRLCYLYFHINSGIKIPAPVQYAERLGALLGDNINRGRNENFVIPGERFMLKPSLFYI